MTDMQTTGATIVAATIAACWFFTAGYLLIPYPLVGAPMLVGPPLLVGLGLVLFGGKS